jgi:hypothetical protein
LRVAAEKISRKSFSGKISFGKFAVVRFDRFTIFPAAA